MNRIPMKKVNGRWGVAPSARNEQNLNHVVPPCPAGSGQEDSGKAGVFP